MEEPREPRVMDTNSTKEEPGYFEGFQAHFQWLASLANDGPMEKQTGLVSEEQLMRFKAGIRDTIDAQQVSFHFILY